MKSPKKLSSTEVLCHIVFKRISNKREIPTLDLSGDKIIKKIIRKPTRFIYRTERGKEQIRRHIAKKYPWYFTLFTQHSYEYTRKGKQLKRVPCKCRHCQYMNGKLKLF